MECLDCFGETNQIVIQFKPMKLFLETVFCKFYGLLKEEFNAMGLITILISINLFSVIGYYRTLVLKKPTIQLPITYEIIIVILIGIFNWIYFLKGNKFKLIYEKYNQNSIMSGAKGTLISITYVIVTFGMLVSLIYLARMNIKM